MKPYRAKIEKSIRKPKSVSVNRSSSDRIHITLVSEAERNTFCVPSYGYLLP